VAQHALLEKPNWDKVKDDPELGDAFLAKAQREVAEDVVSYDTMVILELLVLHHTLFNELLTRGGISQTHPDLSNALYDLTMLKAVSASPQFGRTAAK
jgi:hypothetical protein